MAGFKQAFVRDAAVSDAPAAPVITIDSPTVQEGDSGTKFLVFTVTLSSVSSTPVSFSYQTANGTALAANDYSATKGTLTINAGQPAATISVPIFGDKIVEGDESFSLHLFSATGGTFAGGAKSYVATGTILNDDTAVLKMSAPTVVEGDSGVKYAMFTISLSNRSDLPITFNYATIDGSAKAGSDYVATSGTFTIAARQPSATISVAINGDTDFEGDETFKLNLTSLSGAKFDGGASSYGRTATIVNDDAAPAAASATMMSNALASASFTGASTSSKGLSPSIVSDKHAVLAAH